MIELVENSEVKRMEFLNQYFSGEKQFRYIAFYLGSPFEEKTLLYAERAIHREDSIWIPFGIYPEEDYRKFTETESKLIHHFLEYNKHAISAGFPKYVCATRLHCQYDKNWKYAKEIPLLISAITNNPFKVVTEESTEIEEIYRELGI